MARVLRHQVQGFRVRTAVIIGAVVRGITAVARRRPTTHRIVKIAPLIVHRRVAARIRGRVGVRFQRRRQVAVRTTTVVVVIPRVSGGVERINATLRVAAAALVVPYNPVVGEGVVAVHDKRNTR